METLRVGECFTGKTLEANGDEDMSEKKQRAEAISATAFVEAYVRVHQSGGTIADVADELGRSVEQARQKKNALTPALAERGIKLPKLKRQGRNGSSYDDAAALAGDYLASLMADSDEAETASE